MDVRGRIATDWNPMPTGGYLDEVAIVVPTKDAVLIGGGFLSINGRAWAHLAAFR